MSKLTPAQVEEMASLRERGWSYQRLANRYGVTTGAIHYRCLTVGSLSPKSQSLRAADHRGSGFGFGGAVRYFTADEDAQVLGQARAGKSIEQIAAALGRPRTSVRIRLLTLELKGEAA